MPSPVGSAAAPCCEAVVFVAGVVLAIHEDIGFADLEEHAVRQGEGRTPKGLRY